MPLNNEDGHGLLVTPRRNNFFYGKLLGVDQLTMEQHYFNHKRWLLNRLMYGNGVVCGLDVRFDSLDPSADQTIRIEPGVALDPLGREILVVDPVLVDPHQLTDAKGDPVGDPVDDLVEVCLIYAESWFDPVPVLVPDCDTSDNCAPNTILEGFRVVVRLASGDASPPPTCDLPDYPLSDDLTRHQLLCERVSAGCPQPGEESCVTLARIDLASDPATVEACAQRNLVYGNTLLHELISCMAGQVQALSRMPVLRYGSGDGQTAGPGEELAERLVVRLVDPAGDPIPGALVEFKIASGGGTVDTPVTETDGQGQASTGWTLGSDEGLQEVTASAVGSPFSVTFRATAKEGGLLDRLFS